VPTLGDEETATRPQSQADEEIILAKYLETMRQLSELQDRLIAAYQGRDSLKMAA
jgi:hypothetical protein